MKNLFILVTAVILTSCSTDEPKIPTVTVTFDTVGISTSTLAVDTITVDSTVVPTSTVVK
jgi:hypothetical protein